MNRSAAVTAVFVELRHVLLNEEDEDLHTGWWLDDAAKAGNDAQEKALAGRLADMW